MATTTATRYAMGRRSGLVHVIHDVGSRVYKGQPLTTWKCSRVSGAWGAIHLDEPGDRVMCTRCIAAADDTDERHIYVARVGQEIKVGCSNQAGLRVSALGGELLARTPGGFDVERRVLSLIGTAPSRGREWFPASAEAEALDALEQVA